MQPKGKPFKAVNPVSGSFEGDAVLSKGEELTSDTERVLPATLFGDCYADQETSRYFDVSFVADLSYFESFEKDADAVRKSVEIIVANANLVYFFQFNIRIRLQQLAIVTKKIGNPEEVCSGDVAGLQDILSMSFNDGTCCSSLDTSDDLMEALSRRGRSGKPTEDERIVLISSITQLTSSIYKAGHWHLLTDCFPSNCGKKYCSSGISRLRDSSIGSRSLVCEFSSGKNVGISSRTFQTWLVFAHEIGHNFGAIHSFQHGEGRTGGIMDYGDGKIKGQYAFNKLRKSEFCSSFNEMVLGDKCKVSGTDYFSPLSRIPCQGLPEFARPDNGCGICKRGACLPPQLLLKMNNKSVSGNITAEDVEEFSHEFLVEPCEFSPIALAADEIVVGPLIIADPIDGCEDLTNDISNSIVLIKRGGCKFKKKVQIAENHGALGVIIFNKIAGHPPFPMGGEGYISIPAVSISKQSADEIFSLISKSNFSIPVAIGGFSASEKSLETIVEGFFEKYQNAIITFACVTTLLLCLYFLIRHREFVWEKANETREEIVDLAIENKYRVLEFYDHGSRYVQQSALLNLIRSTRSQRDNSTVTHDEMSEQTGSAVRKVYDASMSFDSSDIGV